MSIKAISLGAFVALALSLGGAATANAGGGHHRFHNSHRFDFRPHARLVLINPSYDFYWKRRYFECKGWW
jgi:hypothetical protein